MRKSVVDLLARLSHRPASIRRRLFWLLWGMSLGTLLVINLAWLPGALQDIRAAQSDLQRVAVRGVRNQLQLFLDDKEQALKNQARLSRPAFSKGIRKGSVSWHSASSNGSKPSWRLASWMRRARSVCESPGY
jgi:hypothetical protein